MDIITAYQKKIVTSKNFIFISVLIAILIRVIVLLFTNNFSHYAYHDSSPISTFISIFITPNLLLSLSLSLIFTSIVAFYLAYLNFRYNLIRVRTYLIYSIVFLVFSAHPVFLLMSIQFIEVLLFLLCIDILFSSYQKKEIAGNAYSIGFILAITSLFSIYILSYLVLFWIGFFLMRSFKLRYFLASILGVLTVYWLLLFYYLWLKSFADFTYIFTSISIQFAYYFKTLQSIEKLVLGIAILFFIIVIFNSLAYAYEDKIKIRAKIIFLDLTAAVSLIYCFLINLNQTADIYIYGACYSVVVAHFFAVSLQKWKVYLFYLFILFIIAGSVLCILYPRI